MVGRSPSIMVSRMGRHHLDVIGQSEQPLPARGEDRRPVAVRAAGPAKTALARGVAGEDGAEVRRVQASAAR